MKLTASVFAFIFPVLPGCYNALPGEINTPPDNAIASTLKTKQKAAEALAYCKAKKMNTGFCVLIDMSLHSGLKRFFVWDFLKDTVAHSFLVGHGCCDNAWSADRSKDTPKFSNVDGSHCSSLGKYKLGERGYSDWGIRIKYLMHGLEASNSNALARCIVFHSWDQVSDQEVYPGGTPEGWGCPTVSNNSMRIMDPLLKAAQKPVLMWVYK
jgi:hypothetical protein